MKDLRLGTEDSSQMKQVIPIWGAEAVTLPPDEIALALRTDRIDGAESTLPTYVDSGYYQLCTVLDVRPTFLQRGCAGRVLGNVGNVLTGGADHHWRCAAEAASWQRDHWQSAEVRAMLHASRSGCYMALLDEEAGRKSSVQRCSRFTNTFPMRRRRSLQAVQALADSD